MKDNLDQIIDKKLFLNLILDGLKGDSSNFEMRARRLASKINKFDSEFAKDLNSTLSSTGALRGHLNPQNIPSPVDADTRQNLLIESYPVALESEPILPPELSNKLARFIQERNKIDELHEEGLLPTRSILIEGPPGVGKTLTAKWIAARLDLPLLTLDIATVMSSYLGKTGNNIRSVLKYATSFPCVLLLDEFDSIAKKRDDDSDVGELKRLVTVILQAVDEWPTTSILIAATNHGELLDPAIWRRFDLVLNYPQPSQALIEQFIINRGFGPKLSQWLAKNIENSSLSDIEKNLNQARKNAILEKSSIIESLIEVFANKISDASEFLIGDKNDKVKYLSKHGFNQTTISEELHISRPTILKIIKNNH